ncbi:MAG: hypothetical protein VXZ54_03545 [Planctomycetota bacterium]|nr:hypothetical protein [Planctomycetota bacterium]MEC8431985.1 hypothetical protein [Planctomycetota bacterium]
MRGPHSPKENPYQSPCQPVFRQPFQKRLRRAFRLAWVAYREGIEAEGMTLREHFRAWFCLFSLIAILILLAISAALYLSGNDLFMHYFRNR